jgi:hypothetical protein
MNAAEVVLAKGSDSPFPKAASISLKLDKSHQGLILHTNIDQPPWKARMRIRCIVFPAQMFVEASGILAMLTATFLKQSIDLLENRFWNETWRYTFHSSAPKRLIGGR